jgi:predicted transcriptional regulator
VLLFLQDVGFEWQRYIGEGVAFLMFITLLTFILRLLPTWKEVRIKDIEVRTKEAETAGQIATALVQSATAQTQLGTALNQLGQTVKDIAIEQRQATENVMILQRVSANESQNLSETVNHLIERMDTLEENLAPQGLYETRPKAIKKS